jgi:hypothetical protein
MKTWASATGPHPHAPTTKVFFGETFPQSTRGGEVTEVAISAGVTSACSCLAEIAIK